MLSLAHVRRHHPTDAGLAVDQQSRLLRRAIQRACVLVLALWHPERPCLGDLWAERIWVPLEDLGDSLLSNALILDIVAAANAIAVLAVLAA